MLVLLYTDSDLVDWCRLCINCLDLSIVQHDSCNNWDKFVHMALMPTIIFVRPTISTLVGHIYPSCELSPHFLSPNSFVLKTSQKVDEWFPGSPSSLHPSSFLMQASPAIAPKLDHPCQFSPSKQRLGFPSNPLEQHFYIEGCGFATF